MSGPQAADARADLHGHVADYVSDQDRRWFEDHPEEEARCRQAFEHEWCHPAAYPSCLPVLTPPPIPSGLGAELWVEVVRVGPGLRARQPYFVLFHRESAEEE